MSSLCVQLKLTFPFQSSRCFGDYFPLYHGRLLPTWSLLKIKKITKQPDKVYLSFCKVILFVNARLTSITSRRQLILIVVLTKTVLLKHDRLGCCINFEPSVANA